MFDNEITADENIATLEAIGILAMRCLSYAVDERPEMREVAEQLAMLKIARKQGRTQTQGKLGHGPGPRMKGPLRSMHT